MSEEEQLFEEVCSSNFLDFSFNGRSYTDQLADSIRKTKRMSAIQCFIRSLPISTNTTSTTNSSTSIDVVWVQHDFGFMGGSLGCAEGEKITRAFELATSKRMPIIVACQSGGARMQEGTSSLMQMAKVSVAVETHRSQSLPFISLLTDPTFGGVSASYAMQADIKLATQANTRIGFAGPTVILNTMCGGDQVLYDTECPPDFQSAQYLLNKGQIDAILDVDLKNERDSDRMLQTLGGLCHALMGGTYNVKHNTIPPVPSPSPSASITTSDDDNGDDTDGNGTGKHDLNYTRSRHIDRPQTKDYIEALLQTGTFIELSGDGRVGSDVCLKGGIGILKNDSNSNSGPSTDTSIGIPVVILGTFKGHSPTTMQASNYGMPSPHGYRTAQRLMQLAERFGLPVITLVDTVGAWPTFTCEGDGQSEAIASNLTCMAGLKTPIVTLMIGEGKL